MRFAPICLFVFKRPDLTRRVVDALRKNALADSSVLYVFSDEGRTEEEREKVNEVRELVRSISGFKSVFVTEQSFNKGLANSIIDGVTEVLEQNDAVIVLEDDLVVSSNFLEYMNQALAAYESNNDVFSISGYTMKLPSLRKINGDVYFGYRASSWGWATWKDRWESVDWLVSDYQQFSTDRKRIRLFQRGGADLPRMLRKQMQGRIDSWAIRFCYSQFNQGKLTAFPAISKIASIGFGASATHTKKTTRFDTDLDTGEQMDFEFPEEVKVEPHLAKGFRQKFSPFRRAIDRLGL